MSLLTLALVSFASISTPKVGISESGASETSDLGSSTPETSVLGSSTPETSNQESSTQQNSIQQSSTQESSTQGNSAVLAFVEMIKMSYQPLALVFVLSIFLYVLIEQGIGTWLPTFNSEVLGLPNNVSVQMTSIFAASLAIGRLLAGQILRYVSWYVLLNICLVAMGAIILVLLPLTELVESQQVNSIFDAPAVAFLLPLIGLLMAPIYPVLNSVMLSSLAKSKHAAMTGLIVVFSALGGTTGSVITGFSFQAFGGQTAFYLSLIPMVLILISLHFFKVATQQSANSPMVTKTTTKTNNKTDK